VANLSVDSFFAKDKAWVTDFINDLPSLAVQMAIRDQTLRGGSKEWIVNDHRDIEHLSVAVPYCDIVVTEKVAANALRRQKLDEKYQMSLFTDLESLRVRLDS